MGLLGAGILSRGSGLSPNPRLRRSWWRDPDAIDGGTVDMDPNEGDMLPAIGEINDFAVTAQAGLQFSLSYTDAANATGHEVEVRPLGTSVWTVIELAGAAITLDVAFPGRTYEFRIRGTSGEDYGPWSNTATATARLL